jgi:hypothetical protein
MIEKYKIPEEYKVNRISNKINMEGYVIKLNSAYKDKRVFSVRQISKNFSTILIKNINLPLDWKGEKVLIKVEKCE